MEVTVTLAVCVPCVCVHVYLSVKWFIDVYSIVLALFNEHVPTFPDKTCGRVGVDGAAQEHSLLLVVTAPHIADGLVHRENRYVKVCKIQTTDKKHEDLCIAVVGEYWLSHP